MAVKRKVKISLSTRSGEETEILDLAEAVAGVFWEPGAAEPINRLIRMARGYWEKLGEQDYAARFAFVLRLLRCCPILYQRPPGFDWVTDYLKWITEARDLNPEIDRALWEIEKKVYGENHKGRPKSTLQDFLRYLKVDAGMNVATPTKEGLTLTKRRKSKAVGWVAETEADKKGGDLRPIWKSLARIKARHAKHAKILQAAGWGVKSPITAENPPRETARSNENPQGGSVSKGKARKHGRSKE